MVDGRRHLRRLELDSEDGVSGWKQAGREFEPDGEDTRVIGRPLSVDDRLFVFDTHGTLYCLAADDPGHRLARWLPQRCTWL